MKINFNKITGKIKPMHAINNAPLLGADSSMFHYIGEAGIPFSRLHDTGGVYGQSRFVDISNVFRNFDADENDPSSYDFAFTDWLLNSITEQGTKIFYRLGVTIENQQKIKAYHIYPPKDNLKWAKICEKIIAHYNEGWADGYHLGIEYWELWNEPDNQPEIEDNPMWKGTFEQYLELYKTASTHLKKCFPNIKIGGYASCGFSALFENHHVKEANTSTRSEYFLECFEKFMAFVKENALPLDFFSWHSYSDVEKNIAYEKFVRGELNKYGFEHTESILNEWNSGIRKRGTLEDAANIAEMMLKMQNTTLDMLMYYDGQVHGDYQGLFNPVTHGTFKAYFAFKAFNELYKLKNQTEISDEPDGIACVAAADENGEAVMLTSKKKGVTNIKFETSCDKAFRIYRLNNSLDLEPTETVKSGENTEISEFETLLILSEK